jgi:hypothetical protein
MSNLSDLIPAGGGQNNTDFVADGGITSGKPVILTAAGKAAPIVETPVAAALYDLETIASGTQYYGDWCYDTVNDKLVLIFSNSAYSQYPAYTIGSVTTNAVSWTTPTVIFSRALSSHLGCCYNATEDRIVMACQDSSLPKAISGTSDGSTITWGSVVTITTTGGSVWQFTNLVEWPGTSKVVWCATDASLYTTYTACGTLSGSGASATSTWGTEIAVTATGYSDQGRLVQMCYDYGTGDQVILTYGVSTTNVYATPVAISGTTMTLGTPVSAISASMGQYANALAYDTDNNKALMVYGAGATSGNATITYSRVISTTGSVITLGTQADFIGVVGGSPSQYAYGFLNALTYSSHSSNFVFMYLNATEEDGFVTTVSISGTTNTWSDNQTEYNDNEVPDGNMFPLYDPDTDQAVLCYRDKGNSQYLESQVFTIPYDATNLTASNLLGIASAAILDTATGTINTWGSRNEVQTSLTIGSDYYAQGDGTITTSDGGQLLGKALSATQINIKDYTG